MTTDKKRPHTITFTVDNVELTVSDKHQTAGAILTLAGLDPAMYDLAKLHGDGDPYQDDLLVVLVRIAVAVQLGQVVHGGVQSREGQDCAGGLVLVAHRELDVVNGEGDRVGPLLVGGHRYSPKCLLDQSR